MKKNKRGPHRFRINTENTFASRQKPKRKMAAKQHAEWTGVVHASVDDRSYLGMPVGSKEAAVLEVMMMRTIRVHLVDHPDQRFFVEPVKFYDIAGKLYLMYLSVSDTVDLDSCIVGGCIYSDVKMIRNTAASVCRALRSAHKHGMVHGNLNPRCVTIDSTGGVRVMFSVAPAVSRYTPPEDTRTAAGDMWALGTMLMDMCGPEGRRSPHARSLCDLASRLTATDPAARMSAQSALAHRAFDGVTAEATLAYAAVAAPPVQMDRSVPIPMARPLSFH